MSLASISMYWLADRHPVSISEIFVYSMRVDGEVRQDPPSNSRGSAAKQTGFAAGSKALDTLEKLMNSTETFFHPTNLGTWTPNLTLLLQRLASDFIARWKEEEQPNCKTPEVRKPGNLLTLFANPHSQSHRLTPQIRRRFVKLLSTPALLGMFSKDSNSAGHAQGALHSLALLEPSLVMPELLERAYGGLEVVNETHRTTAVLSTLARITRPLLTESVWLGGQKNLIPLLELCLPGIDLVSMGMFASWPYPELSHSERSRENNLRYHVRHGGCQVDSHCGRLCHTDWWNIR